MVATFLLEPGALNNQYVHPPNPDYFTDLQNSITELAQNQGRMQYGQIVSNLRSLIKDESDLNEEMDDGLSQ